MNDLNKSDLLVLLHPHCNKCYMELVGSVLSVCGVKKGRSLSWYMHVMVKYNVWKIHESNSKTVASSHSLMYGLKLLLLIFLLSHSLNFLLGKLLLLGVIDMMNLLSTKKHYCDVRKIGSSNKRIWSCSVVITACQGVVWCWS